MDIFCNPLIFQINLLEARPVERVKVYWDESFSGSNTAVYLCELDFDPMYAADPAVDIGDVASCLQLGIRYGLSTATHYDYVIEPTRRSAPFQYVVMHNSFQNVAISIAEVDIVFCEYGGWATRLGLSPRVFSILATCLLQLRFRPSPTAAPSTTPAAPSRATTS